MVIKFEKVSSECNNSFKDINFKRFSFIKNDLKQPLFNSQCCAMYWLIRLVLNSGLRASNFIPIFFRFLRGEPAMDSKGQFLIIANFDRAWTILHRVLRSGQRNYATPRTGLPKMKKKFRSNHLNTIISLNLIQNSKNLGYSCTKLYAQHNAMSKYLHGAPNQAHS